MEPARTEAEVQAMPRPPRFSYAHAVHHVTLRCNNREFLFTAPAFDTFAALLQEARFRSTIIEAESYLFRCLAYVALNPVRAGMVADPLDYPWSAHRAICEEDAGRVALSREYLGCGADATARSRSYLQIVADEATRPAASLVHLRPVPGTAAAPQREGVGGRFRG